MPYVTVPRVDLRQSNRDRLGVTFHPDGRLTFSAGAGRILAAQGATAVELLWDADAHRMALRPCMADAHTYKLLRNGGHGTGRAIYVTSFLAHIGMGRRPPRRQSFAASWNMDMFEITLSALDAPPASPNAVREDVEEPVVTTRDTNSSSSSSDRED